MPQQQKEELSSGREGMNLLLFAVEILNVFPAVFLHRPGTWGKRYPVPVIFLAAMAAPALAVAALGGGGPQPGFEPAGDDAMAIMAMWGLWFVGALIHKTRAGAQAYHFPSYYDGIPLLWSPSGKTPESAVKRYLEPLLCIGFGYAMTQYTLPAFGMWWIACGFASGIRMGLIADRMKRATFDRLDAEAEAEVMQEWTERYRSPS